MSIKGPAPSIPSGLTSSPGLELEDPSTEALVQMVIAKCLEKEALCNEFYMQLIKQSTDQPDPNSRINVQNWRFLSLTCGVVVPRSKALLNYLWAHLKFCALEANTEEGKYAQYCIRVGVKNRNYNQLVPTCVSLVAAEDYPEQEPEVPALRPGDYLCG